MPPDRLVYFVVAVPVLLAMLFLLLASPCYALFAFFSARVAQVRARAAQLMLAWLIFVVLLAAYFASGYWYRENTAIRPVAGLELVELAGFMLFGVILPGIAYRRLLAGRRSTGAADGR